MWIQNLFKSPTRRRPTRRPTSRPCLEALEERCLLSFGMPVDYGIGLTPETLTSADFNNDGRFDLAVADGAANTVSVLLGNADGAFLPVLTSGTGAGPRSVLAMDFNSDGKTDLVTINRSDLSVLLGNGDGTFQPPQSLVLPPQFPSQYTGVEPLAQTPISVAVGDLNSDGELDLVVEGRAAFSVFVGYDDYGYPEYQDLNAPYLNVLIGNGDGTFAPGIARSMVLFGVGGIHLGDFNGDGRMDVVASNQNHLGVYRGNGDGTLQDPQFSNVAVAFSPNTTPVRDFNGDGKLDLLMTGSGVAVMHGNGDGTFLMTQILQTSADLSALVGDVNTDGKLDIVVLKNDVQYISYNEYQEPDDFNTIHTALVFLGNGDGSFALPLTVDLGTAPDVSYFVSPTLADFDGDGFLDLAATEWYRTADDFNYNGSGVYRGVHVMLNDGNWTLPPPPLPPSPSIHISDGTVTEGNTGMRTVTFTVTLSAASEQPVTVNYTTANGTATAGSDYQVSSGTLTIPKGQTSGTIIVLVNGDRVAEANETFFINLSSPTNANIADAQGKATIVDDEPRLSINDVSKIESNSGTTVFRFMVTLSSTYDETVTINFNTADGTAKAGGDYQSQSGTLTFGPGETVKYIDVIVYGDTNNEADESFFVQLTGASSNVWVDDWVGEGWIVNDDTSPGRKGGKKK